MKYNGKSNRINVRIIVLSLSHLHLLLSLAMKFDSLLSHLHVRLSLSAANETQLNKYMIIDSGFISSSYLFFSSRRLLKLTQTLWQGVIWSNGREREKHTDTHTCTPKVTSKNPQNHAISQQIANFGKWIFNISIVVYCFVLLCAVFWEQTRDAERDKERWVCVSEILFCALYNFKSHWLCVLATANAIKPKIFNIESVFL